MSDLIERIRADAKLEQQDTQDAIVNTERDEVVAALESYFAATQPSASFDAALEILSARTAADAPPGRAAASAARRRPSRQRSVLEALGAAAVIARSAIIHNLGVSADGAELLLERPASALLTYDPAAVGHVAELCQRPRGELFAVIAESARSNGQFVFAYRPGGDGDVPAIRPIDAADSTASLIAWGRALFELPAAK